MSELPSGWAKVICRIAVRMARSDLARRKLAVSGQRHAVSSAYERLLDGLLTRASANALDPDAGTKRKYRRLAWLSRAIS